MRIVSGRWRGFNLFVPDTADTRPTMDRTRQAVFNILRSASWAMQENGEPLLNNAHVLDVFAGSGAMGFEALSQGAQSAVFFENNMAAVQSIERNRQKLKLDKEVRILKGDILKSSMMANQTAQIAFFDPPYNSGLISPALQILRAKNYINDKTLLVLEIFKFEGVSNENINVHDTRNYGTSKVVFGQLG